jgi:hypothetical protein
MKSDNLLINIIDTDNIILKIPTPLLTLEVDNDKYIINSIGNFGILNEIPKIAYIGPSKNTLQTFSLLNIYVYFKIGNEDHDDEDDTTVFSSKYEPSSSISKMSLFIINTSNNLPQNFNLFNVCIKSFKIIANYIYGHNKISSIVRLKDNMININYPIKFFKLNKLLKSNEDKEDKEDIEDIEDKEDEYEKYTNEQFDNIIKGFFNKKNKKIIENFGSKPTTEQNSTYEHSSSSGHSSVPENTTNPFTTVYWLIPLSIVICGLVQYYCNIPKKSSNSYPSMFDSLEEYSEEDDGYD